MDLTRINWQQAAGELADEHRRTSTPKALRALANVASLRGRFTDDFAIATASTQAAIRLEPLDPIHHVRDALVRLRFGDVDGAIARLDALPEGVNDLPIVLVVKSLATARRGEARTARNIADRALAVDGKHDGARFLYTEANLAAAAKGGLDKLGELPKGARFDAAWADLLAKLAILRPGDLRAVNTNLTSITKGSKADAIARAITAWVATTTTAELEAIVVDQEPSSRAEQVALGLLVGKLEKGDATAGASALRALRDRCPERPAIRRALASALTRLAVGDSGAGRYSNALRAVQMCIELEPHEAVHYQNRAALFTLIGEHDAALDAWAELDRHHYRLALVGRLDVKSVQRYAAPHRMFARDARLSPGKGRHGVFVIEEEANGPLVERSLATNQEGIDRDPEQLRQWLHHSRASLAFAFVALGHAKWLLAPPSPVIAEARASGLCALVQSLAIMVPDEGRALADKLAARFRATPMTSTVRYAAVELDAESRAVHEAALELFAELAMVCVQWAPDPKRRGAVDEVVDTVRALAPFFDDKLVDAMLKARHDDAPPHAMPLLKRVARSSEDRVAGFVLAHLRTSLAQRRWEDAEGNLGEHELDQLIETLDLARKDCDKVARVEYWAARFAFAGDFLDDAVAAIKRFHTIAKTETGDHPMSGAIAKLQEAIDTRGKDKKPGKRRDGSKATWSATSSDAKDFSVREAELEDQPTSMSLYADLCHDLGLANRWRDAHAWATRALARCLTPAGQLRARELALELEGLEILAGTDGGAAASYIAGARAAAVAALEKIPPGVSGIEYVRGLALLAADRRPDAQAAFQRALAACKRGIFMGLLRPLASDLESALLDSAKKEIDAANIEGRFVDAFARIAERMATVKKPEPYVLELARTQFSALLPTIGTVKTAVAPPQIRVDAAWRGELARVLQIADPYQRTTELVTLAKTVHPPAAREADALARKLEDVAMQLVAAKALDEAAKKATAGDFEGALARLGVLGPAGERNARVQRQRAIVLLRLERYAEADAAVETLRELPDAVAREFATRYPGLRVRQQIASASAFVRTRELARAREILATASAVGTDQVLELAYCRACIAAAEGYRKGEEGDRVASSQLLLEALTHVERVLDDAKRVNHDRLVDLHAKLEKDVG